ncbi:MAG: tetratricopeptide repeat protein [Candidatus Aminicenantes bacterium]|nr:MAG: tetratricopeptide repeat protein [Candidatus Aminicenantes bacterium]
MKKYVSAILVSGMVLVLLFHFSGCEKLKISSLQANYHLKQANKFYQDEVYRKAIDAYETALNYNPNLKLIYVYLGTSYSQIYRPMKDDERNRMFGEKAEEYLVKAKEYEPEREEVIVALGDLYDKMGNFEKAEEYYKMILEKKKEEPKSYYTLANFYEKNGKTELAEEMYKQRIGLNTKDPEGYHYFVGFLQNQRRWEEAIDTHKKRLYAMLDPDIIDILHEIVQLQEDTEQVKKTTEYMEMVKKNRRVDAKEKKRLLAEAEERIKDMLPVAEAEKKLEELQKELQKKNRRADATAETLEDEVKQKVAETYYSIGNVCWNWSYQTPTDFMAPQMRKTIIENGLENLEKATKLTPDYADPYAYMGLLWREMIKVDPLQRDKFIKKNEEFNKKFLDIYQRKKRAEEYRKQLEEMGQELQ